MTIVSLRPLLDHAAENAYAVASVNVMNMEQIQAALEAAHETDSPVILQVTRGSWHYCQRKYLRHLFQAAAELYPHLPICLHLDHGNSLTTCARAIEDGFSSVMIDGSFLEDGKTRAIFEQNVAATRAVVEFANSRGVSVEAEVWLPDFMPSGSMLLDEYGREPGDDYFEARRESCEDTAAEFAEQTGVDVLAIACLRQRRVPGRYKDAPKSTSLDSRLVKIHQRMPNRHLSVHAVSWLDPDLRRSAHQAGSYVRSGLEIPTEPIREAIRCGVRKIVTVHGFCLRCRGLASYPRSASGLFYVPYRRRAA